LTLESVRAETIRQDLRDTLARQVSTQIQATVRREEEIELNQAEELRLAAAGAQTQRAINELQKNQEIVNTLMVQFDQLMTEGQYNVLYNGGGGDIAATTAPFYNARVIAQQARALEPTNPAPYAGVFVSEAEGFLA